MSYEAGEILKQVRAEISKLGNSEYDSIDKMPQMQELFDQMQALREEMNEAKKEAAAEAAKPYLEMMETIEKRYAVYLKLTSNN